MTLLRPHFVLLTVLALAACKESKPESKPSEKKEAVAAGKAEVEFFGKWAIDGVEPAKVIFVAQAEPCAPVPEKPTRFGEVTLEKQGPLFAEFFIPQGTVGHACVYGLDASGKVISAATDAQNPMTFKGEGEVIFGKLDYTLKP
jgi:hypothetical protein